MFSRVEDVLGDLNFPANERELNNYYYKVMEMNGTSKKKIEEIFKGVYELDAVYAKKINEINDKFLKVHNNLVKIEEKFS